MSASDFDRLRFRGMPEAYPVLRDEVLRYGETVSPRGEDTLELRGVSFSVDDAVMRGVPVGCGRKVGVKMMAIDGSGNLAGESYPDVAIRVAPVLARFADPLPAREDLPMAQTGEIHLTAGTSEVGQPFFQGAYGPRIGAQLELAEEQLRRDWATRQAVVSLWRPSDRDPRWKDRPCTTEFQLMLRKDGLHMFVFMRANDLWTGTCYDVFQFGQVQAAMANVLGVPHGPYHHYATSLHVYQRNVEQFAEVRPWREELVDLRWERVPAVDNPRESFGPPWDELEPRTYCTWAHVRENFASLLEAARHQRPWRPTNPVEAWYWEVLK